MAMRLQSLIPRKKRSLLTRFQIGLGLILFAFCLMSVVAVYNLQRTMLEREALRQTNLVMNSLQATRRYVRETLRPKMYEILPPDSFVIESMSSSYITRVIMQNLGEDLPEFSYRRVAVNPRNPKFAPEGHEQEMITYFREHPELATWTGVIRRGGQQRFIRYQPVIFTNSCLFCHGDPRHAPPGIIDRYGSEGGFYRQAGEVSGVISISIPLDADLAGIRTSLFWLFCGVLASGFLLFLFIRLFFSQLVVVNIQSLLASFRETVLDTWDSKLYEEMTSKDEISELSQGMQLLAEHIRDTRKQLEHHASNLEEEVSLRTEALEKSHDQLRYQVNKRNRELHLFTAIAELTAGLDPLENVLSKVLRLTLKIIPCEGGAIYLRQSGEADTYTLLCVENIANPTPQLKPAPQPAVITTARVVGQACNMVWFLDGEENRTAIPLCCRNTNLGFFLVSGLEHQVFDEQLRDLLLSIGNQIGIAIESVQKTAALRRSERLLNSVFKGISDPLALVDSGGTVKMVNEAFLTKNDLDAEEVIGKSITELPQGKGCCFDLVNSAHLDWSRPLPKNATARDEEGNYYDVLLYPVVENDDTVSSVICLARDITETKQVELKLRQTEKLAAVGQLAAGVAHELNNPLWVILCHADIIKSEHTTSPGLIEDIEIIEKHARHCQRIISDLLNFTRNRENETAKRPVSINDDIRHVISMAETQFAKKEIRLSVDLDPTAPVCLVDSDRMQQVFLNLLINAGQAVESDGTIIVRSRVEEKTISIQIEDEGPGIDAETMEHVFDPFFTTKEQGAGTGLGLSVSYGIIKEHDGEIQVASHPGKTIFTVVLPLCVENHDD